MAPHDGGVLHHCRDDDSGSVYYHPVVIFFGLLLLCMCIMAPMFWVLWMMRNDNRDDMMTEEQLHRARDWKRVRAAEQQQAAQQPAMQDNGDATNITQTTLSQVVEKMRKAATSTQQVIVSQSQLLWKKTSESFTGLMRRAPRRSSRPSRTGVSIELPIMRQPAWQKLASGSADITASNTLVDFSKPTSMEIDMAAPAGPSSYRPARDSDKQIGHHGLGQHGGIDSILGAGTPKAHAATTVGLALG